MTKSNTAALVYDVPKARKGKNLHRRTGAGEHKNKKAYQRRNKHEGADVAE